MNPYGQCHHTKYEGCPPCVHSAWEEGVRAARDAVAGLPVIEEWWEAKGDYVHGIEDALSAIDALRGES